MLPFKKPSVDLRKNYRTFFQISLIITLSALILIFKFFPEINIKIFKKEFFEPSIEVKAIPTIINRTPPPPASPVQPIIAFNSEIIDIELVDVSLKQNDIPLIIPPNDREKIVEDDQYEFIVVEDMPELIGGLAALMEKIRYPELAKKMGVEGTVIISGVIDEHGNFVKAEIIKGIGMGCDEQALNAVLNSKFIPGKQRGKTVRVKMTIPIVFRLK
jgi:periplasmic protein TonB